MRRAILAACLVPAAAHAQPGRSDVTVDEAIALYRDRSPQLAAARAAVDVTAADVVEARIYPNPTVGIMAARTVGGTDTIGVTQPTLTIEIPILIGHQRGRREAAAMRRVEAARADVALAQGEAELTIRAKFTALAIAQDQTIVIARALSDARALREIVAGRSSAGAGSPYALERLDLALAALASRVDEATAVEASASGELAIAVGIPGWHPRAAGGAAAAPPVVGTHPALAVERAAREAARADEVRAKADAVPTPSLTIQAFGTTDPTGIVMAAGVSVPLPLSDRNQGAIARARTATRRADLAIAARESELTARLDRASRVLAVRRESLSRFQTDALQRLDKLRAMAEASYRAGQGGIVELLDALEAITDARLRELELRASVAEAELDVRRATAGR